MRMSLHNWPYSTMRCNKVPRENNAWCKKALTDSKDSPAWEQTLAQPVNTLPAYTETTGCKMGVRYHRLMILHKENLRDLYRSTTVVTIVKCRSLWWTRHVDRISKSFWHWQLMHNIHLINGLTYGKITLRRILVRSVAAMGGGWNRLRIVSNSKLGYQFC